MSYTDPNVLAAWRCVRAIAAYMRKVDDSPRAAGDLEAAIEVLIADAKADAKKEVKA